MFCRHYWFALTVPSHAWKRPQQLRPLEVNNVSGFQNLPRLWVRLQAVDFRCTDVEACEGAGLLAQTARAPGFHGRAEVNAH